MENGIILHDDQEQYLPLPMKIERVQAQMTAVQELQKAVMKEDTHYGVIPGTPKPTLYKAGAEKLLLTFGLTADFPPELIRETIIGSEHRQYTATCVIRTLSGRVLGQKTSSCSTMEGRYRWRGSELEFTDKPVPAAYWDLRSKDPKGAQDLLGGKGHIAKKNDLNQWVIAIKGDPKPNPDIADCYNTCLQMAQKRAMVSGTVQVLAVSDIFAIDLEDLPADQISKQPKPAAQPVELTPADVIAARKQAAPPKASDPQGSPISYKVRYALPYKSNDIDCNAWRVKLKSSGFEPDTSCKPWEWEGSVEYPELAAFRVGESAPDDDLPPEWEEEVSDGNNQAQREMY